MRTASHLLLVSVGVAGVFVLSGMAQAPPRRLTITLAGQSMIRSDLRVTSPASMPVMSALLKGDVKFTNFEAVVTDPGEPNERVPETRANGGWLTPAGALAALQTLGFNLVSLSNNHAWDLKAPGISHTLREAKTLDLAHAGIGFTLAEASDPGYLRTPNGTVALIAMASGEVAPGGAATEGRAGVHELRVDQGSEGHVNGTTADQYGLPISRNDDDARRIVQKIRQAKSQADLVIVYQHNHIFEKPFEAVMGESLPDRLVPPTWIKQWAHEEVDVGADIVVMHGAPLIHGVEIYRGKPIFYDLGNFIFNLPPTTTRLDEPIVWESVIAYLEYEGKVLRSIGFRPVAMNKIGEGVPDVHDSHANNLFLATRGLSQPATGNQARYILQRLVDLSRPFGTAMTITGETATIQLPR